MKYKIPYNKPHLTGREMYYIKQAGNRGQLAGDGLFTKKCQLYLKNALASEAVLLTPSCTAALEMIAILSEMKQGDEVIMPSYTFVSTANAFALRNIVPVFVDIRRDTLNIDEAQIESAITSRTKAIMVVHYAGVGCEMDAIQKIARKHRLFLYEDAAHALLASYDNKPLGSFGDMATLSFHETKNVISGEGGALIINNKDFIRRAEIVREKGTDRKAFISGHVDKYTWVDIGSSYLPGEVTAAFLYAQLQKAKALTKRRVMIWERYNAGLENLERNSYIKRPTIPKKSIHNGHIYYILTESEEVRNNLVGYLKKKGILAISHYVPLHTSRGGIQYGKAHGKLNNTNLVAKTLLRLPIYYDLKNSEVDYIIQNIYDYYQL